MIAFRHREQVAAVRFQPRYLLPHSGIQGLRQRRLL
jgi:hypothetical protein